MAETDTPDIPVERWTVVQVAAFMSLSYQVARNNMLAGDYGMSDYDANTRRLTVIADHVRVAKSARDQPIKLSVRKNAKKKTKKTHRK